MSPFNRTFPTRRFRPTNPRNPLTQTLTARYQRALTHHPFLLFGLPFISIILGASFILTPATALRYERHDRRMRRMSKEEALGLGIGDEIEGRADDVGEENKDGDGGVVDGEKRAKGKAKRGRRVVGGDVMRDEFYRLQAKDLEDWENRRVERLPGEHDGRL